MQIHSTFLSSDNTIYQLVKKFRETGSVQNKQHVRRRTVLTQEKLEEIDKNYDENPRMPLMRRKNLMNVSYCSVRTAAKLLGYKDWSIRVVHELKPEDYPKRVRFCNWFKNSLQIKKYWIRQSSPMRRGFIYAVL